MEQGMREKQTCIACGKSSPETETNYTLISAQFGWRLTRFRKPDGTIVIEWRCADCWEDYKKHNPAALTKPGASPPKPSGTLPATPPGSAPSSGSAVGAQQRPKALSNRPGPRR